MYVVIIYGSGSDEDVSVQRPDVFYKIKFLSLFGLERLIDHLQYSRGPWDHNFYGIADIEEAEQPFKEEPLVHSSLHEAPRPARRNQLDADATHLARLRWL